MLEAALCALFHEFPGCQNIRPGGDGGLRKRTHYLKKTGSPRFFLYVAVQNSNVDHPIGKHKMYWPVAVRERYDAAHGFS